jgi:hypothetical protein
MLGSIRILALITSVIGAGAASAGEAAARRVIGFSPDGAYFAMEEFGHSDPGMGNINLHSYISIVDTKGSDILDESVQVSLISGDVALAGAVHDLATRAAAVSIRNYEIGTPGRLIGADKSSRAGEEIYYLNVWAVEKAAKATLNIDAPEIGGKGKLILEYAAPARTSDDAEPTSETAPTFVLTLVKPGGKRIALTKAIADPESRGAFYKYAIAEAHLLPRASKTAVIAAIVETFTVGGEGVNRNFIPVAIELPAP